MTVIFAILVLLLTTLASGTFGYWLAGRNAAPTIADLGTRVEMAERGLYSQGQTIRELTEALRGVLTEFESQPGSSSRKDAISVAQQLLMRH